MKNITSESPAQIQLSYIILHRSATQDRVNNLYTIVGHLSHTFPEIEIIVVEQDDKKSNLSLPPNVKHVFVYNNYLFNRSWGFNVGFRHASHAVIAFGDNDIILSKSCILESYNTCQKFPTVNPYSKILDLDKTMTEQIVSSGIIPDSPMSGKPRAGITYAGGVLFMTKAAIQTVGGWDERMWGWGREDDAMTARIERLLCQKHNLKHTAYHLYHSYVTKQPHVQSHIEKNTEILIKTREMPIQDLKEEAVEQFTIIGDPNLVKKKEASLRTILLTGGAGYIGSHTAIELLQIGYNIIIVDDFSNSKPEVIDSIKNITNRAFKLYNADITDKSALDTIFKENHIDAVIHFAGHKAVGESNVFPMKYYQNNIIGTLYLCETMQKYGIENLIFSSSATVYSPNNASPLVETMPLGATNPYGRTKLMIEQMLSDLYAAKQLSGLIILRYFNPVGAHESGLIGENPNGIPNNLMPFICQVASGKIDSLTIHGNDYQTKDGTGIRDFIHVVDLARGHIAALENLLLKPQHEIYNLGTGIGYSVLELINNFEAVNNIKINYQVGARRNGDVAICYADASKAERELGWKAQKGIQDMCKDAWLRKN